MVPKKVSANVVLDKDKSHGTNPILKCKIKMFDLS